MSKVKKMALGGGMMPPAVAGRAAPIGRLRRAAAPASPMPAPVPMGPGMKKGGRKEHEMRRKDGGDVRKGQLGVSASEGRAKGELTREHVEDIKRGGKVRKMKTGGHVAGHSFVGSSSPRGHSGGKSDHVVRCRGGRA